MASISELKKKFKAKKTVSAHSAKKATIKAIAREYEMKKAELTGGAPDLIKRGPLFYGVIIIFLVILGSLVTKGIWSGQLSFETKEKMMRKDYMARKAMDSLSRALGRYKFHVGEYPATSEGLEVLAIRDPKGLKKIRRAHPGWDGPYVDHIVKDPWGEPYVYETREEGGHPILYSKGPDRRAGTTDDVMPEQDYFDEAFRDTSWTNHWAPAELRGYVLAPDEETLRRVEAEMRKYD